jgi:hypothetical protein
MAQETRVNPIQYSDIAASALNNLVALQQRREETDSAAELARYKLREAENLRVRQEAQKKKEDIDKEYLGYFDIPGTMKGLSQQKTTELLGAITAFKGSDQEKAAQAKSVIEGIYRGKQIENSVNEAIEKGVSLLPEDQKKGINVQALKNMAIQDAFYNRDANGQLVRKDLGQMDPTVDYVSNILGSNKALKIYDPSSGHNDLVKFLKDVPSETENLKVKTRVGNSVKSEMNNVTYPKLFYTYNPKTEEVKLNTDENGYIADNIYKQATTLKNIDRLLESRTDNLINDYNSAQANKQNLGVFYSKYGIKPMEDGQLIDPESPESRDLIKKAILTDYVKNNTGVKQAESSEKTTIINTGGGSGGGTGGGAGGDVGFRDAYGKLERAFESALPTNEVTTKKVDGKVTKTTKEIGRNINSLGSELQPYLIDMANKINPSTEEGKKYTQDNLIISKQGGSYKLYEWKPDTKSLGKLITSIDPETIQAKGNKELGTKSVRKALSSGSAGSGLKKYTPDEIAERRRRLGLSQ